MGSKKTANHQEYHGAKHDAPAVRDRAPDKPVVKAVEAPLALLFNTGFFLSRRSLYVVAQEWNERHGNNERAQQRSGHHEWKAFEELPGIACQHQERKIGDYIGDGGKEDCSRQFRRTEPRSDAARKAVRETSLYPIPGYHRHVDQEPQRDNECRYGNLLEINTQHVDNTEGHGECDGYCQGHDECKSPLPEAEERDDNDKDDRFVQRPQEKMDVFLYLQGLVGGVHGDEIWREDAMELCEFRVDGLAEFGDLLLIAHIDGDRNGSTAAPMSVGVLPCVVVQVIRRALVSAAYIDEVAQVDGSSYCRCRYNAVTDCLGALELPGRR